MAYSNGKKGDIGISMVDVVDNCYSCFPRSGELGCQKSVSQISQLALKMCMKKMSAHVFPFFWLIRSAISRFKARFASKFTGSHALSKPDECQNRQAAASRFQQHCVKLGEEPTNESLELGCVRFRGECAEPIPSGHPGGFVLQLGVWREALFSREDGDNTNTQGQALCRYEIVIEVSNPRWRLASEGRGVTEADATLVSRRQS